MHLIIAILLVECGGDLYAVRRNDDGDIVHAGPLQISQALLDEYKKELQNDFLELEDLQGPTGLARSLAIFQWYCDKYGDRTKWGWQDYALLWHLGPRGRRMFYQGDKEKREKGDAYLELIKHRTEYYDANIEGL